MRHSFLFLGFFLIVLLAVFHVFSTHYYIYWTNGWTDHVTHFLGGAGIGLIGLWCASSGIFGGHDLSSRAIFLTSLISALVVGAAWEVFELKSGIIGFSASYKLDTIMDIVSDLAGGFAAALIGVHKKFYA